MIGIFAQGAPADYEKYQANYDWYLGTYIGKDMDLVGKLIAGGDTDTDDDSAIMKQAYELGMSL